MTNQIEESQFKLVAELLKRQDDALEQLDLLCDRVERAIEENVGSRESEGSADSPDEHVESEAENQPEFGQDQENDRQDRKAA